MSEQSEDRKRTFILISVSIGMLMTAMDTTIVLLALPTMTVDLKAPFLDTIWVILVYLLVLATLTTQMGKLGDIFGRGRIFNAGFLIFIVGSAMAGASPNVDFLIISRIIQGLGAVLLQANMTALISDYFSTGERGKAFGITIMWYYIGMILGIILGGVITTFIGWRYIFYLNVPLGLLGFYIAEKYIKDNRKSSVKIDYTGTVLLIAILGLISYGAVGVASVGANITNISMVIAGLIILFPFVIIEERSKSPIIDTRAFKNRKLSLSLMAATLQAIGFLSVLFILIIYLQGVRGFSPFDASLILVPGYLLSSLLTPKMGKLSDKIPPGKVAGTGILIMAIGIVVYLFLDVTSPIYLVIIGSIITGLGGSLFWPSNTSSVMSNTPRELYGSTSGLLRTLSNTGTLLSYVIAITVAASTVSRYVTFEVFLGLDKLRGNVSSKFVVGLHSALLVSMIVLVIGAIMSFITGINGKKHL